MGLEVLYGRPLRSRTSPFDPLVQTSKETDKGGKVLSHWYP